MKRVVIIGGGFLGTQAAMILEKNFEVILIDNKEYFEYTPSILRAMVNPSFLPKIQIKHKDYLDAKVLIAKVKEITPKQVITSRGKLLYDYLVIGTGSFYGSHLKDFDVITANRGAELKKEHKNIEKAKTIAVIGGGLVGVEAVGEIIATYPKKEVHLIHAHNSLMERNHKKAIHYAQNYLTKHNVILHLNEKGSIEGRKVKLLNSGKTIVADEIIAATGIKPNFEPLKKMNILNERNLVKVNNYLQVEGYPNIFSGGDICSFEEEKTAQAAEKHAKIIAKNILHLENKKALKAYKKKARPMLISIGDKVAILQYKKLVLTGFIPSIIKSFVEWKTMMKYR